MHGVCPVNEHVTKVLRTLKDWSEFLNNVGDVIFGGTATRAPPPLLDDVFVLLGFAGVYFTQTSSALDYLMSQ